MRICIAITIPGIRIVLASLPRFMEVACIAGTPQFIFLIYQTNGTNRYSTF